jgi:hypothetical protein
MLCLWGDTVQQLQQSVDCSPTGYSTTTKLCLLAATAGIFGYQNWDKTKRWNPQPHRGLKLRYRFYIDSTPGTKRSTNWANLQTSGIIPFQDLCSFESCTRGDEGMKYYTLSLKCFSGILNISSCRKNLGFLSHACPQNPNCLSWFPQRKHRPRWSWCSPQVVVFIGAYPGQLVGVSGVLLSKSSSKYPPPRPFL